MYVWSLFCDSKLISTAKINILCNIFRIKSAGTYRDTILKIKRDKFLKIVAACILVVQHHARGLNVFEVWT